MNTKLNSLIIFAAGAAIGSAVTWKLVKTKYERIAQEEIDSVKAVFFGRDSDIEHESEETEEATEEADPAIERAKKPDLSEYMALLRDADYVDYTKTVLKKSDKDQQEVIKKPYVISPDDFGETDYRTRTFTYYADKVLTDEDDEPVENIELFIGEDSLQRFGDYEDDSVHVRNDELRTDFEILLDMRNYWEDE